MSSSTCDGRKKYVKKSYGYIHHADMLLEEIIFKKKLNRITIN